MAKLGELISQIDGRLTLTSGVPVTTSDVTAATTIYFTPYKGNHIALYNEDFEDWRLHNFTELSYSLAGIAADTNFDVFVYNNAGTLSLEIVAWSDATTRATALAVQDGVYVKSSEPAKRYLGTFRTTSTIGQCEDRNINRLVWNYYNRIQRSLFKSSASSHTYSTASYRAWNNDTTMKVGYLCGVQEDRMLVGLTSDVSADADGRLPVVYLSQDTFSSSLGEQYGVFSKASQRFRAGIFANYTPLLGYHYVGAVEIQWDALSSTFEFCAISGSIFG